MSDVRIERAYNRTPPCVRVGGHPNLHGGVEGEGRNGHGFSNSFSPNPSARNPVAMLVP